MDLENPTLDEIVAVTNEFDLGSLFVEELLTPTAKPHVDIYPGFVYTVLHFPALRFTHGLETSHEIDIVLGKDFIITVHYTAESATYDLTKMFEAAALMRDDKKNTNVGIIFLELAQRLYQAADNELDALEDTIRTIEDNIFEGKEKEMVSAISIASRELFTHKRLLGSHHDVLGALENAATSLLGDDIGRYIKAANTLHYRVHSRALIMSDVINELRETNIALLSTRQNEIMKNLTIMAFVTFPLTLIAAVFGMNTRDTPIVGAPHDFIIILVGMGILTVLFFAYFKLRKWF